MANVNQTLPYYVPSALVGAQIGSARLRIGLRVGSARLLGNQHVGIGNAKVSRWGYCPMRRPNMRGFALWWNIGLSH